MRLIPLGPLALTIIASLVVAVVLLAVRVVVMQRVQSRRQRENRQETERLRSMVAAYRSLAGSFSPALEGDRGVLEEALADIVLFGSLTQVEMAARCARALAAGGPVETQALVESLRADLRVQLGLEPIPDTLRLPPSGPGPGRGTRGAGRGDGEGRGNRTGGAGGAGGGGFGGGIGGAAAGASGLGVGLGIGEDSDPTGRG